MLVNHATFNETALTLALQAGEEIMRIYETDFNVETKGDDSPVTEADQKAEAIILKGLKEAFPNLPVVAEEEAAAGNIPDIGTQFVLVDPLDGTREFIGKKGAFTVNIALIENNQPVAGVVHAPAMDRTFTGVVGIGAAEYKAGKEHQIQCRPSSQDTLTAVASRSHLDEKTAAFLEKIQPKDKVSIGSSLKFCLIAAAEADIYPRFGRTMEWDTAAGHAVLAAAGGSVENEDATPFMYGKRKQAEDVDFANPAFIARGDYDWVSQISS